MARMIEYQRGAAPIPELITIRTTALDLVTEDRNNERMIPVKVAIFTVTLACAAACPNSQALAQETPSAPGGVEVAGQGRAVQSGIHGEDDGTGQSRREPQGVGAVGGKLELQAQVLDGTWSAAQRIEREGGSKGILGGRYFILDTTGKMEMPGPDGKMIPIDFKGMEIEGYNNVKKRFESTWVDNMGTGTVMSTGAYDAASKTFTYQTEEEVVPGEKTKNRYTITVQDKDHHVFAWFTTQGDKEVKTMEISYSRDS